MGTTDGEAGALLLPAARRFRVVAAFLAAARRFRVAAAFWAADVAIGHLLRIDESLIWLT
jgi:hypothetical protein